VLATYTFLDLFCGAGGLSSGFDAAGFQCVLALDHSRAAVETHRLNFASPAEQADVTTLTDLPRATVVVGGPPCQGFSSAGMRAAGDARNTLVGWYAQTIARLRPTAFVFENVEGLLTAEDGYHVFELLDPLIAAGYCVHLRKINAANFGVPQHRKRVIAIGGLGWIPTFPEFTHTAYGAPGARLAARHLAPTPTLSEALSGLPPASSEPPGEPRDHFAPPLVGIDLERAIRLKQGETMRDLPAELWHESYRRRAFRRVMDGTPTEKRGGAPAGLRRLRPDEPSKAITGAARSEFLHPVENRNLTLRECARLQTFSDDFVFGGSIGERQQLIGNAVPPRLAHALASSLRRDLESNRHTPSLQGQLVSFVPTLSTGMSPALSAISERVETHFGLTPGVDQEQMSLWR
jgi:DNA (cytosine-5)-methyltransferase 1